MQTIVNTLMFPDGAPGPVMVMAPWLDARFDPVEVLLERLDAQTHRRAIKTHTPADGIPWFPDVSYITVNRDGRDVFMSMFNHLRSMRADVRAHLATSAAREGIDIGTAPPPLDDEHAFFPWWLENAGLLEHVASFWERARRTEPPVRPLRRHDRRPRKGDAPRRRLPRHRDRRGEAARDGRALHVRGDEGPSRRDRTASNAVSSAAPTSFLYKGTNGRWRDVMTDAELAAYEARVAEMLPPDAATWLAGRSATG